MDTGTHTRLMDIVRRIEQQYNRRTGGYVRPLDHQTYLRILSVFPTPLNILEVDKDMGDCFICQETFKLGEKYALLPCNTTHPHKFHESCIRPWLKNHDTCPTCRGKV